MPRICELVTHARYDRLNSLVFRQFLEFFPVNNRTFRRCSAFLSIDLTRISDISNFAPRRAEISKMRNQI